MHLNIWLSTNITNTNFSGSNRQGKNNLFKKLYNSCSLSIVSVGRVAHILNNCIRNWTEVLLFDIVIIVKKFKYFYIYTVRVSTLKDFCDSVEIEYEKKCYLFFKNKIFKLNVCSWTSFTNILQKYYLLFYSLTTSNYSSKLYLLLTVFFFNLTLIPSATGKNNLTSTLILVNVT